MVDGADAAVHDDPEVVVTYIGIDPGVSGGIACLTEAGRVLCAGKMPDTDRDLFDFLETAGGEVGDRGPTFAVLERVHAGLFAKPGQRMGVVSAFTFGGGYRAIKMALTALQIPYDEVLPAKWQTALGCRTRGDKNISKARAQQLFPTVRCTHAISDALLIAEFCRRTRTQPGQGGQ